MRRIRLQSGFPSPIWKHALMIPIVRITCVFIRQT